MKIINNISKVIWVLLVLFFISCEENLTELNENPNAVTVDAANPNLLLSTVLTESAKNYLDEGYGELAGVMQHQQKDAWYGGFNNYEWGPDEWSGYYSLLRTNKDIHELALEKGLEFHQGVTLVMRAFLFGQIADKWGDAPYINALKGKEEVRYPSYDSQETIYQGIIEDLKAASELLSKNRDDYTGITATTENADVIYSGDPGKWRKFANSLLLRYYMRISHKKDVGSDFADIVNNQPIFTSIEDDATMDYLGNSSSDSWPANTVYDGTGGSNFRRRKACATMIEALRDRNDPRIGVWFARVQVPTVLDNDPENHNETIDGVRHLHPDSVNLDNINTNPDYVGIPPSLQEPSTYNYNPTPGQESYNKHVSFLDDKYREPAGEFLKARLMSYDEVCFLLAEAAHKGWISGEQNHYENGIRASLETWGVCDQYGDYIDHPDVSWDGSLEQLMTQKWMANWTKAQEAWCDYRRTGFPDISPGPAAQRTVLPVRYIYGNNTRDHNTQNYQDALNNLEETPFSRDEVDSPWSKPWLLQGTDEPY